MIATRRRTLGVISSTLLLPAALAVMATGILADVLDLNEFVLHKYAGYAAAVLTVIHVICHWPSMAAFWTRTLRLGSGADATGGPVEARTATTHSAGNGRGEEKPADVLRTSASRSMARRTVLAAAGAGAAGFTVGWLVRPTEILRKPGEDYGALYHRASAPGFADALGALVDWGAQPARTKSYPGADWIDLPAITQPPGLTVASAIGQRRSLRDYADRALTIGELSWLLNAAAGITGTGGLRAAPSAGAQYPIETYIAITRVDGIEPGIYHNAPDDRALTLVRAGNFGGDLMLAALGQEFVRQAPVVVVLSAIFQRLRWRYRERAYRFALMEAGHIGQNVYLAAEAAGLGACVVASFVDDALNRLIGLDGVDEAALVLLPVGPR